MSWPRQNDALVGIGHQPLGNDTLAEIETNLAGCLGLQHQVRIANEILLVPASILPLPSQWISSAATQGKPALHYRQVADGR